MKCIFLDFDGVIVTMENSFDKPNKRTMKHLQDILDSTQAEVVVSSSWRVGSTNAHLEEILGFKIKGVTSRLGSRDRGEEIETYLEEHPEIEKYIILDDEEHDIKDYGCSKYLVKTNIYIGLTTTTKNKAISMLKD